MAAVQEFPADAGVMEYGMRLLPDLRITPGAVRGLAGPDNLGPEHAGALSLVFGSFADEARAQRTYRRFAEAQAAVRDAPGFLRWLSFNDGPHGYGLGWWRSAEDAAAFARGPIHREMVREQRAEGLEYSQFAGVWTAQAIGRRNYYCPSCLAVTPAPAASCSGCGVALDDGFSG
jgi:heme-degrading monooxygenase HmoA